MVFLEGKLDIYIIEQMMRQGTRKKCQTQHKGIVR